MDTSTCTEALGYYNGTSQHIVIYFHTIASFCSLLFTTAFLAFGRHLLFFHTNFKILMYILLGGYLVHGVALAGLQLVHIYVLWSANSLCDLYLSNQFCYFGRFPSATATNLFVYCQMAMIVERILATRLLRHYERMNSLIGSMLGIFVIGLAVCSVILMFERWDLTQLTTYCGTSNTYTAQEVFYVTSVSNAVVALITLIGCSVVIVYNMRLKHSDSTVANVLERYQNAENRTVLKILAPQIAFLGVYLVFYGGLNGISFFLHPAWANTQLFKSTLTFVNIIPYYTAFSPLLIWYLLRKHKEERKILLEQISTKKSDHTHTSNTYFESYRTAWN